MEITIQNIDESEIHQGREIQEVQYSFDAKHWWRNDDEESGDIIDVPMYSKFKRYVYTDGSVSLPIISYDVTEDDKKAKLILRTAKILYGTMEDNS